VLDEAIQARAFPGCAFGVLAGGRIVFTDALGRFTYEEDAAAVTAETVYDVASITKVAATTAAVMLLHQRGLHDLETPLGELLPGFVAGRAPGDFARHVKLRHLLAHNSGLPGCVEFFRNCSTAEAVLRACLELPLEAEPGARVEYSDPGFILLGKALEAVTGEPLAAWTRREIFQPLGMASTGFCPPAEARASIPPTEEDTGLRRRRIQGEVQDENAWLLGGAAGHAGLFSNVPDLLRFAREILLLSPAKEMSCAVPTGLRSSHVESAFPTLKRGANEHCASGAATRTFLMQQSITAASTGEARLFSTATIGLFARRQGPAGSSRALGWDTPSENSSAGRHFSPHSIGHLGFTGCSLWIDLEAGVAAALLTNRTWPGRQSPLIRQVRPAFHDAVRLAL
jgi:CubicO group peptidase (beta-lactamase class C family)